jgi:hypothetical protein
MKDTNTLIIIILISILAIGAVIFDLVMIRRKGKERRENEDAVARVMKKYRTITLCRPLAAIAVGRLSSKEMRGIAYEIYRCATDPDSFFFITRREDDTPVMEPIDRFLVVATSENYSEVITLLNTAR